MTSFVIGVPAGTLGMEVCVCAGQCKIFKIVAKTGVVASLLHVGDLLTAVDGVPLRVGSYMNEWVSIFRQNAHRPRSLSILRPMPYAAAKKAPPVKKKIVAPTKKSIAALSVKSANSKKESSVKKATTAKKTYKTKNSQYSKKDHLIHLPRVELKILPENGFVCDNNAYYATLNNDTPLTVAEKLGSASWKDIAYIHENVVRYGELKGNTLFRSGTLLRIPPKGSVSKFKLDKLQNVEEIKMQELAYCITCHQKENPNDPNDPPMLLCDGCDSGCHLSCTSEFREIPKGDWFCPTCLDILQARKTKYGASSAPILTTTDAPASPPPPMVNLSNATRNLCQMVHTKLRTIIEVERADGLQAMDEMHVVQRQAAANQVVELESRKVTLKQQLDEACSVKQNVMADLMRQENLVDWNATSISVRNPQNGSVTKLMKQQERQGYAQLQRHRTVAETAWMNGRWMEICYSDRWRDARARLSRLIKSRRIAHVQSTIKEKREAIKNNEGALKAAKTEVSQAGQEEKENSQLFQQQYAARLGEPRLSFETKTAFEQRKKPSTLLGFIKIGDEEDVLALEYLQEPVVLIDVVPLDNEVVEDTTAVVGKQYGIFARDALFDSKRDDELPLDVKGVRCAQRRLMAMILAHPFNQGVLVSTPTLPSSVKLRGTVRNDPSASKCYDLSELVRDCNCDLDLPQAPTPLCLAKNGLKLRDYQQSSLQWMLDKEREIKGLGLAEELWSHMYTLDNDTYYYCELTGTFSRDIFNLQEPKASKNYRGLPCGGILGEEMGLGKTIICLALIVANPPLKANQMLPREHKWTGPSDHAAYCPPPSVRDIKQREFLSNATLVIAPVTLCSQWKNELEKFAPLMNILTIHNGDNPTIQELASADVVVVSTFVLQSSLCAGLLNKVKRVHWHRLIVDESHYNQSGQKTQESLAMISSGFRWCSTGTPVGHSLGDLQGQLRFLRIPQFGRDSFWNNNIRSGYSEHNDEALRILRSLLSRVVIRHSKEQTDASGAAMLALPPRTVTTEILPFGSEDERKVYEAMEVRNQSRFQELRRESTDKVLSKFIELTGMMYGARQACSHVSMIDLVKMETLNRNLEREREREYRRDLKLPAKKVIKGNTRASILAEAISKAKPSAQGHVRHVVRQFQEGEIELLECPICLEPFDETQAALTPCGHPFCGECILNVLDGGTVHREASGHCPQCRTNILRSELTFLGDAKEAGTTQTNEKISGDKPNDEDKENSSQINGFTMTTQDIVVNAAHSTTRRAKYEDMTKEESTYLENHLSTLAPGFLRSFQKSCSSIGTKVSRLLEEIKSMMNRSTSSKCVVFSQFLGILDVAAQELSARGIPFVRVDGHMKQHERADALLDFSSDSTVTVFLLSMRAGAVGLTLTAADHCFILDIPQNASVEEQAIDRIHRIGQTRPVTVKRFVMKGTCEERILTVRRSMVSESSAGTQLDGTATMNIEARPAKRARKEDEEHVSNNKFERLKMLEVLFGCTATAPKVAKA